jgi:hypothetical protein
VSRPSSPRRPYRQVAFNGPGLLHLLSRLDGRTPLRLEGLPPGCTAGHFTPHRGDARLVLSHPDFRHVPEGTSLPELRLTFHATPTLADRLRALATAEAAGPDPAVAARVAGRLRTLADDLDGRPPRPDPE